MSVATLPKAFAVMFEDLERWSVNSFFSISWQWQPDVIKPLGRALVRRQKEVDRNKYNFDDIKLITLHFDGEMEPRVLRGKNSFKGKLYFAYPNDMVYSKIDVRNGAIGIVSENQGIIAVSSEYPVYQINEKEALPLYIKLVFRSTFFIQAINNMISGASGRKRVQPSQLENLKIPLPSIKTQKAIVDYWQKGQSQIVDALDTANRLRKKSESRFISSLGIKASFSENKNKAFALTWETLSRWDLIFAKNQGTHFESVRYPNKRLADVIIPLKESSRRIIPAKYPKEEFGYIGMENVETGTGKIVNFKSLRGESIKSATLIFDSEHILYGKLRPYLRKVTIPAMQGINKGVASSEFVAIKPKKSINRQFLAEFLRSYVIAEQAKLAIGARMPRVSMQMLLDFKIPIPPIEKQQAIIRSLQKYHKTIEQKTFEAEKLQKRIRHNVEEMILSGKNIGRII